VSEDAFSKPDQKVLWKFYKWKNVILNYIKQPTLLEMQRLFFYICGNNVI
jgi:hypothetical protein